MSTRRSTKQVTWFSIIAVFFFFLGFQGASADPVLNVTTGGETRHLARDALLARPDVISVEIIHDVAYGKTMRFRAIPLAVLLTGLSAPADSVLEAVALDGFAAQLPLDLVTNTDPAEPVAWLALEPAEQVEEIEDLLGRVARDAAAALRHDLDDADGLETPHGVHNGLLADPKLGLDLLDRDPGPSRVLAAEQALLELVEDDGPQALACAAHRRLDHVDSFVLDDSHCMG